MNTDQELMWASLQAPAGLTKNEEYSDLFTISEYRDYCLMGVLVGSDGSGCWATATHHDAWSNASPSKILSSTFTPPAWATHVTWYDK